MGKISISQLLLIRGGNRFPIPNLSALSHTRAASNTRYCAQDETREAETILKRSTGKPLSWKPSLHGKPPVNLRSEVTEFCVAELGAEERSGTLGGAARTGSPPSGGTRRLLATPPPRQTTPSPQTTPPPDRPRPLPPDRALSRTDHAPSHQTAPPPAEVPPTAASSSTRVRGPAGCTGGLLPRGSASRWPSRCFLFPGWSDGVAMKPHLATGVPSRRLSAWPMGPPQVLPAALGVQLYSATQPGKGRPFPDPFTHPWGKCCSGHPACVGSAESLAP